MSSPISTYKISLYRQPSDSYRRFHGIQYETHFESKYGILMRRECQMCKRGFIVPLYVNRDMTINNYMECGKYCCFSYLYDWKKSIRRCHLEMRRTYLSTFFCSDLVEYIMTFYPPYPHIKRTYITFESRTPTPAIQISTFLFLPISCIIYDWSSI